MTVPDFHAHRENQDVDSDLLAGVVVEAKRKGRVDDLKSLENEMYRRSVAAPMLSEQEELSLFDRVRNHGDLDAEALLMASYARLVISSARQLHGYGIPFTDLVQEGNVGLLKAIRKFEPERGLRLGSMAMHWIRSEMKEYALKNFKIVRMVTTKGQRKLFYNLRSAKINLRAENLHSASSLTLEEADRIATLLCVKPSEVLEMERRLSASDWAYDTPGSGAEEGSTLAEQLSDPSDSPEEILSHCQREWLKHEGIKQAMQNLDARSQRIVSSRWIDVTDDGMGLTLHDLATEFGLSKERIRQIEVEAFKKMKVELHRYA